MNASFPPGFWPPKLCFLKIGGLKKPISEWGLQNFPSSLTTLRINGFEKLESVSMGFQHLSIDNCPKMMDMPEMLLASLLSLRISRCSNLKEWSSRGGYYWPLISLIPWHNTSEVTQLLLESFCYFKERTMKLQSLGVELSMNARNHTEVAGNEKSLGRRKRTWSITDLCIYGFKKLN